MEFWTRLKGVCSWSVALGLDHNLVRTFGIFGRCTEGKRPFVSIAGPIDRNGARLGPRPRGVRELSHVSARVLVEFVSLDHVVYKAGR